MTAARKFVIRTNMRTGVIELPVSAGALAQRLHYHVTTIRKYIYDGKQHDGYLYRYARREGRE